MFSLKRDCFEDFQLRTLVKFSSKWKSLHRKLFSSELLSLAKKKQECSTQWNSFQRVRPAFNLVSLCSPRTVQKKVKAKAKNFLLLSKSWRDCLKKQMKVSVLQGFSKSQNHLTVITWTEFVCLSWNFPGSRGKHLWKAWNSPWI